MIQKSTIQLLRFPFSYFLMPVYFFALSLTDHIHWPRAILVFFLLHLLLYPSSNGYNSYMDRDTASIGGLEKPLEPSKELYYVTVVMDLLGIFIALLVSNLFAACYIVYILFSRLYSWRGIRLKKFAVLGYLTVIVNQGALVFFMVQHGASIGLERELPIPLLFAASLLIGGFYPITQIYQHQQDAADGVKTISMLLGKRGTFLFCIVLYLAAFGILFYYFLEREQLKSFFILQTFFIPVVVYFLQWFILVWKHSEQANFKKTMRMNWLASTCTSAAFITLLIMNYFG